MKVFRNLLVMIPMAVMCVPSFAQKADSESGKAIFTKRCATCHGPTGEGKEEIAKMMKAEIKHLGSKEVQARSDADLRKIVRDGKDKMKPVKDLNDQDLSNVIAYLRTLAHK